EPASPAGPAGPGATARAPVAAAGPAIPGSHATPGTAFAAPIHLRPTRTRLLLELCCGLCVALAGALLAEHALTLGSAYGLPALSALVPGLYALTGAGWALKAGVGLWRPPARVRLDGEGVQSLALWPPRQRVDWQEVATVRRCRLPLAGQVVFVARQPGAPAGPWWRRLLRRLPLVIDARSVSMDARELVPLLEGHALASAFREPAAPPTASATATAASAHGA
ncbi:MAG: hypothetical protein ACKOSS_04705, partial [Planctomycetia bacterium]